MQIEATIRIPGVVWLAAWGAEVPRSKPYVSDNDDLYIEGERVGRVVSRHAIRPNGESVYVAGQDAPVDYIVHYTDVDCILELPGPPEKQDRRARCACGELDSPNHRVMCWQADRV